MRRQNCADFVSYRPFASRVFDNSTAHNITTCLPPHGGRLVDSHGVGRDRRTGANLSVELQTGVEPALSAWKADALPLSYCGMVDARDPRRMACALSRCVIASHWAYVLRRADTLSRRAGGGSRRGRPCTIRIKSPLSGAPGPKKFKKGKKYKNKRRPKTRAEDKN